MRRLADRKKYLLSFGEAYFNKATPAISLEGNWLFLDGTKATITQSSNRAEIRWKRNGTDYFMAAIVRNFGARIIKHTRGDHYLTESDKGYAFLSNEQGELNIMTLKNGTHSFFTLKQG